MFAKRLEILAEHLERIAVLQEAGVNRARKFSMEHWFSEQSCGTAACAMGEACFIPELQDLGLFLDFKYGVLIGTPNFQGYTGFRAAAEFFDITYSDAEHLFAAAKYSRQEDPAIVARCIRTFIARGGRQPSGAEEFVPLCWVSGVDLCAGSGK